MAVIYRITNMANNHYYIGSAESFARREWQHRYDLRRGVHKNPKLQAAWKKYGEDMFVFEVVEEVATDRTAFDIENTYLMKCVGQPDCYNINADAFKPRLGQTHSDETKAKIKANRRAPAGAEHYRYGKQVSPEVREKIGATQRGKPKAPGRKLSEEGRQKVRANIEAGRSHMHWLGKKHTAESKRKMSKPIVAVAPSGAEIHMVSITHMCLATGLKGPTIHRALKSGKPVSKGPHEGWSFKYKDALAKP